MYIFSIIERNKSTHFISALTLLTWNHLESHRFSKSYHLNSHERDAVRSTPEGERSKQEYLCISGNQVTMAVYNAEKGVYWNLSMCG